MKTPQICRIPIWKGLVFSFQEVKSVLNCDKMDIVKDQNQAEQTDESLLWLEGFFVENTPEKRQDRNVYVYVCL